MPETSRKQAQDISVRLIKELEALPDTYGKGGIFSPEEDDLIRKYYPTKGGKMGHALGKTTQQINHRASILGVRKA